MIRHRSWILLALTACGPTPKHGPDGGGNPDGNNIDAPPCGQLVAVYRDFRSDHPDFEKTIGDDRGLVQTQLGGDDKPVYAPPGATLTVSGPTSFDQWYRDTAGINMHFEQPLPLTDSPPGTFTFDNQAFFPLDGMGWPNQEVDGHNFHFTTEIHGTFAYHGGEHFEFTGDDDVFVFVNKTLALDLGGVHGAETAAIDFDASAATLGIALGGTYHFDIFHAERHTTESHFRMSTTIDCLAIP